MNTDFVKKYIKNNFNIPTSGIFNTQQKITHKNSAENLNSGYSNLDSLKNSSESFLRDHLLPILSFGYLILVGIYRYNIVSNAHLCVL